MSKISELANWPETENEVTVERIRRSMLVWAVVYEWRLANEPEGPSRDVAAAWSGLTAAGVLLGRLEAIDPAVALEEARRYWNGSEDGEPLSDALTEALEAIEPDLTEAVIVAIEAEVQG